MIEFKAFPKIGRLRRGCVVTEKIDGTNASIIVSASGDILGAGSRNRLLGTKGPAGELPIGEDNYGFRAWTFSNFEALLTLGPGHHYGEWWGQGIQRRYGLTEKRFSLFNAGRWSNGRPDCCHVVPTLYAGEFDTAKINATMTLLGATGSIAAPGWMEPEGIVVFHSATGTLQKQTFKGDAEGKERAA